MRFVEIFFFFLRQILCTVMPNSDDCIHRFVPIRMNRIEFDDFEGTNVSAVFLSSLPASYPQLHDERVYISIYKTISIDSAIPLYTCVCVHIRVYVLFLSILRQEIRDHERGRSDGSADKFIPVESRTIDPRLIIARTSCYDIRMKCVCKANSNKWYFHK